MQLWAKPRSGAERSPDPSPSLRAGPALKSARAFTFFFLLYPLWWFMGLGQLGFLILAVPLGLHLLKRRTVHAPRGFALWLLFLGVVLASAATLWSRIPTLAPPGGLERLVTFAFWLAWFLAASIFLLYVGNVEEARLSSSRIVDLLAWMFLVTVAGGYAGQFLWRVDFPSLLEFVLPNSVVNIGLVEIMIHPGLAQIQDIIGYVTPRPKAPWTYANSWGANFGLLLPFFVLAFTGPAASRTRKLAFVPLMALVLPPAIFSLNRGLWAGLVVLACYLAVRLAQQGRIVPIGAMVVISLVSILAVAHTSLGDLLLDRLANPHSNQGRANLATKAVTVIVENSPVVGLGAPQEMEGNFFSAAAGATDACPKCSPPQLGTQGSAWFIVFTTGFAGAVLFFSFLARRYGAGFRQRDALSVAMTATGAFLATVIWVYDIVGASLVFVMIALGLLWRREANRRESHEA